MWSDALHLVHRDDGLQLLWWGKEWIGVSRKRRWLPKVPPESHERKRRDWLALPMLGHLFSTELLKPCISDPIEIELDTTPHSDTLDFFGFHLGSAEKIDTGLRRAAWEFCLQELRRPTKADAERALPAVQDDRLIQLIAIVGEAHLWDTLHVWTAERSNIPIFLSMDRRFANQFENTRKHHASSVKIMSPSDVVEGHGLSLAQPEELLRIRDIFRQQQLRPMCQFRWPKSWIKRYWLIFTEKIEVQPFHGRLEIPNQAELKAALLELELRELGIVTEKSP